MANTIRPIVRAAFKCDALVYQFTRIDVEDGLLVKGDIEEVNAKYSDEHIMVQAIIAVENIRTMDADKGDQ